MRSFLPISSSVADVDLASVQLSLGGKQVSQERAPLTPRELF